MKKIAIIAPSLSLTGGAERTAALLANALDESFYRVTVFALTSEQSGYKLNDTVLYKAVDQGNSHRFAKNIKRIKYLTNKIKEYDLIIGYTIQGGIMACLLSFLYGKKCIVCERQDPYQFSNVYRILRDLLYRGANGAVFQTLEAKQYFKNIVKNSTVIPNFIDDEFLPEPEKWEVRENLIVTAGRLTTAKDHHLLIKSITPILRKHPEYKLIIFGDGPLRQKLTELITENKMDRNIILYGRTERIFELLSKCKIFVLSSRYEGYPNALLEAMCMELACISTDCPCGGPRDMITPNINGQLVQVGDVNSMSQAIEYYITNQDIAKEHAHKAYERRSLNAKGVILEQWLNYINQIL